MDAEEKIARQARAALIAGIVSLVFLGFVLGPGAIIRAYTVHQLVETHGVGHAHLRRANHAIVLGIAGTVIWLLAAVIVLV